MQMAQPVQVDMPTYVVYRDPSRPFDAAAPLAFFPAKDSDELFDALRVKFPHLKTHSARMREAVIEFLAEEASLEPSPQQMSTWSSPETVSLPTSSFGDSPRPLSRQFSVATSTTAPSEASPPGLEQMTGVFSLTDSNQPKQRIRRKMTEQEKIEYRKRRIVKACEKCAKRKRKCNHNQQDMEIVATKSEKIPRSTAASTTKKPPAPNLTIVEPDMSLAINPMELTDTFGYDSIPPFEDFGSFLDMPLPDLGVDDMFTTSQNHWPWADTPDFTLLDSGGDSFDAMSQNAPNARGHQYQQSPTDSVLSSESDQMFEHDMTQFVNANRQASPMIWEHLRTGQQPDVIQSTQTSQNNGPQSATEVRTEELQRRRYAQSHDWNADDIHNAKRDLTEQDIQEVQRHLNERARGDGRRATHSQTQRELWKHVEAPASNLQNTEALHNTEQTSAANDRQVETGPSSLDANKSNPHNIHTVLNSAKRKTHGIDASIMIPSNSNQQQTSSGQEDSPTSRQQLPSLGELGNGIIANTSPSTELFMLRRRIPKALHSIVDRNNSENGSGSMSSGTTNATARLQPQDSSHDDIIASQISIDARRPNQDDSRNTWDIADVIDSIEQATRIQALQTQTGRILASRNTSLVDATSQTNGNEAHEERLSDHMRRRDHFGRHLGVGMEVLSAVAGLGCLLILLSLLPSHTSNLSLLLVALTSAVRGAKGTHLPRGSTYWSEMWGTHVPCTTKDGSSNWWMKVGTQVSTFMRLREDTSSSTWVKETGHATSASWSWRSVKRGCEYSGAWVS